MFIERMFCLSTPRSASLVSPNATARCVDRIELWKYGGQFLKIEERLTLISNDDNGMIVNLMIHSTQTVALDVTSPHTPPQPHSRLTASSSTKNKKIFFRFSKIARHIFTVQFDQRIERSHLARLSSLLVVYLDKTSFI